MHRAAHQLLDVPPILDDPMAIRIVDPIMAMALNDDPVNVCSHLSISPFRRAFAAVRSRYAEEQLARAVAMGCNQYVILGAGLDTFCLRCPHPDLRIFEVDHPATQQRKLERLGSEKLTPHKFVKFFSADFQSQSMEEILHAADVDLRESIFFSWLGVTQYLPRTITVTTLQYIASLRTETRIVFDYLLSPRLHNAMQRSIFDTWAPAAAANGEPFCNFFEPYEISSICSSLGFRRIDDLSVDTMNSLFCSGRTDGLKVESVNRLFSATVWPRSSNASKIRC
jgi:methyltransferase (TIGR00027 family)